MSHMFFKHIVTKRVGQRRRKMWR